jgi:acetyltransferase-like isoleucine patch superfamily enzyme
VVGTSFLTESEVEALGLESHGRGVLVSRLASIHQPERIRLGSHVRIDDFAMLTAGDSGGIEIGNHVHIGAFVALYGGGGIAIESYVSVSARGSVYSTNDDYSGDHLTNPTVSAKYTSVNRAPVRLGRHVLIGAHSVVLPGVSVGEGAAVGALSLVNRSLDAWGIYGGVPAAFLKARSQTLLALERAYGAASEDSPDVA